ncbi:AAA family ATPase [Methanobrevibacter sp. TMH8]|uniref:ATP-dependent nuclease n=1 Tax=Methanobrevibacter sp. TMH8 TaxID=2848611 RepID=UPI001CC995DB|nr:AAA family ATPase [Methanobrevibacter sp. TMH8]MBZ9570578.1 AAA family ATPase [Methanobrevibacter sp. TMH8]
MITRVKVINFRSLKEIDLNLEEDTTLIIGENDAGKTSLIDVLKFFFDNKKVDENDFHLEEDEINIEVETNQFKLNKKIFRDNLGNHINTIYIRDEYIENCINEYNSESFNALNEEDQKKSLIFFASLFTFPIRSNTNLNNLKNKILDKLNELKNNNDYFSFDGNLNFNVYFLDGKHFEDINVMFNELYFKQKKKDIWELNLDSEKTLFDFIDDHLKSYASELNSKIDSLGIKDQISTFVPNFNDLSIKPILQKNDIKIELNVELIDDGGNSILLNKKGDGTKRRITMALFEHKNEDPEDSIVIFDEPDTHLHVKAQYELVDIIRNFNNNNRQVLLTSHSPFLMNAFKPQQIRIFSLFNNQTEIKSINNDSKITTTLTSLGIVNTNLFFSKKILILEGVSELIFLKILFERKFGCTMQSNLIKLVNREGITDIPRFISVLNEFIYPLETYVMSDNDGDEKFYELMSSLDLPDSNVFYIGNKEFEDAFDSKVIYYCWKKHVESKNRNIGTNWTIEKIDNLKKSCLNNNKKFSKKLRQLNTGSIKMTKPILAQALGEYVEFERLDDKFIELINKLRE